MNKRHRPGMAGAADYERSVLVILGISFLLGVFFGCLLASFFQKGSAAHLFSYLDGYFSVLETEGYSETSVFSTLWEIGRWPLFAGVLGATLFGVIALPVLLFLRGFLLSYAASVLICLYSGWKGLLLSVVIFGIPALCSTVCLFVIGRTVLGGRRLERTGRSKEKSVLQRQLLCGLFTILIWIFCATVIHHWISPAMLKRLARIL